MCHKRVSRTRGLPLGDAVDVVRETTATLRGRPRNVIGGSACRPLLEVSGVHSFVAPFKRRRRFMQCGVSCRPTSPTTRFFDADLTARAHTAQPNNELRCSQQCSFRSDSRNRERVAVRRNCSPFSVDVLSFIFFFFFSPLPLSSYSPARPIHPSNLARARDLRGFTVARRGCDRVFPSPSTMAADVTRRPSPSALPNRRGKLSNARLDRTTNVPRCQLQLTVLLHMHARVSPSVTRRRWGGRGEREGISRFGSSPCVKALTMKTSLSVTYSPLYVRRHCRQLACDSRLRAHCVDDAHRVHSWPVREGSKDW